jgi:antitoxin (DNA-binding transcriptional repressor) of toxin-antitoxin stability system
MKTLSIRELHATTGKIVRAAQKESFFVTDHGTVVAVLRAANPADMAGRPFPKGHWSRPSSLRSKGDSTLFVRKDRDR